jgi:hypothetical protein
MVNGGIASPFLTSALNGGEWSVSCSYCFTLRGNSPRLDRPQSRSGRCAEKKIIVPAGNRSVQAVARRYTA